MIASTLYSYRLTFTKHSFQFLDTSHGAQAYQEVTAQALDPGNLDLSPYDRLSRTAAEIPLENLIKSEQAQSWNDQLQSSLQCPRFSTQIWRTHGDVGPITEPIPMQFQHVHPSCTLSQIASDTADSGYVTQLPNLGESFDQHLSERLQLDREYTYPSTTAPTFSGYFGSTPATPCAAVLPETIKPQRGSKTRRQVPVGKCPECSRETKNPSETRYFCYSRTAT
jgi:hypothetical protein